MNKIDIPIVEINGLSFVIFEPEEFHQSKYIRGNGLYERDMLEFIKENYSGGTFIDIGTCLGNHTLFFSKIANKVFSFEPLRGNYLALSMNLLINDTDNVTIYNVALGDKDEIKEINREPGIIQGSASFTNPTDNSTIKEEVIVKKLDDFNIKDVKLIKIDVEEYNIPVLTGAIGTIKEYKPDIFIECALKLTHTKTKDFLERLGYKEYVRIFNATPTYLYQYKGDTK